MGFAYDASTNELWLAVNNTWYNSGDPAAGTGATMSSVAGTLHPFCQQYTSGDSALFDFGQTGFTYTPPTGFKPLSTAHLPDPAILDPSAHFNVVVDTGTSAPKDVTFGGNSTLKADLLVRKNTDTTDEWKVIDRIRGATKELNWDSNAVESTDANGIDDLSVTDGFGLGTGADGYNDSGEEFVTIGWKADGTTGSSNTDGTVAATVSANPSAGQSYGTFTTPGTTSSFTVGHGLSTAPTMIWVKRVSGSVGSWVVYHVGLGATKGWYLDAPTAPTTANFWNNTAPTTTIINMHTDNLGLSDAYEFFAFSDITGYSKAITYTGNANADGPFVPLDFRPRGVYIYPGATSATSSTWIDAARDTANLVDRRLYPSDALAESVDANGNWDFLSNGMKAKSAHPVSNGAGTYYAFAWAEAPFKYARAR
jgi:hypothetical protein